MDCYPRLRAANRRGSMSYSKVAVVTRCGASSFASCSVMVCRLPNGRRRERELCVPFQVMCADDREEETNMRLAIIR